MTAPGTAAHTRFRVNGRTVETGAPDDRRLIDVLRLDLGLTGTKEGCGEGECGACSVLLDGVLVNSCLVPLAQVDGCDILTVEGLSADGRLAPLQEAFLELGGTQCGMCAPGMLLAGYALLASGRPAGEPDIREAIAGNICRCTGYTKIIEAIEATGAISVDPAAVSVEGVGRQSPVILPAPAPGRRARVARPSSLHDALVTLATDPDLRPVAGGTDVMVERAPSAAARPTTARPLLDLWSLDELHGIEVKGGELVLGACTTFTELRESALVHAAMPVLAEVAAAVGAVQVRNRGTVGGNCMTASPAGDLLPVLLATDARLAAAGLHGTRMIRADAFWTGYRQTALQPGELLVELRIPLSPGRQVRFRKVAARRALAIAKVLLAVAWREEEQEAGGAGTSSGAAWRDVRIGLGSVAPTPVRGSHAEAALEGRVPGLSTAAEAAAAVQEDITPIDDIRSTAAYRRAVTGRILRRMVLDAAG